MWMLYLIIEVRIASFEGETENGDASSMKWMTAYIGKVTHKKRLLAT